MVPTEGSDLYVEEEKSLQILSAIALVASGLQAFVRSYVPGLRVEMSDNRFAGIAAAPFRFGPPEPKN